MLCPCGITQLQTSENCSFYYKFNQLDLPPVFKDLAEYKSDPAVSDTSQDHLEDPPMALVQDVADCESGSTKIASSVTIDCESHTHLAASE